MDDARAVVCVLACALLDADERPDCLCIPAAGSYRVCADLQKARHPLERVERLVDVVFAVAGVHGVGAGWNARSRILRTSCAEGISRALHGWRTSGAQESTVLFLRHARAARFCAVEFAVDRAAICPGCAARTQRSRGAVAGLLEHWGIDRDVARS